MWERAGGRGEQHARARAGAPRLGVGAGVLLVRGSVAPIVRSEVRTSLGARCERCERRAVRARAARGVTMDCRAEGFDCGWGACSNASGAGEDGPRCVCDSSWALDVLSQPRCSVSLPLQRTQVVLCTVLCSVVVAQLLLVLARGRHPNRRRGVFQLIGLLLNLALLATDLARWWPVASKSGWVHHSVVDYTAFFFFASVSTALALDKYTNSFRRSVAALRGKNLPASRGHHLGLVRVSVRFLALQASMILLLILIWESVHSTGDIAFFSMQLIYCCAATAAMICYTHAIISPVDAEIKSFLELDDALSSANIIKTSASGDKARRLQRRLAITYRSIVVPCAALTAFWLMMILVLLSPAGRDVAAQATNLWLIAWYPVCVQLRARERGLRPDSHRSLRADPCFSLLPRATPAAYTD